MDPDICLLEMLKLAADIISEWDADLAFTEPLPYLANELAEHVQNLDTWISNGGFIPARWTRTDGN